MLCNGALDIVPLHTPDVDVIFDFFFLNDHALSRPRLNSVIVDKVDGKLANSIALCNHLKSGEPIVPISCVADLRKA